LFSYGRGDMPAAPAVISVDDLKRTAFFQVGRASLLEEVVAEIDRGRDAGANWTFSGSNTVSVLANNGGVGVSGSLVVSSIDPSSSSVFVLVGATLEVASALWISAQMAFSSATLQFADTTLGSGTFLLASDGGTGTSIALG
jgi:hypothetical protein